MNQYERLLKLITSEELEKIKKTTILVLGIGGVGGACVEVLARTGIGNIILADFDTIDITNLNRQIITNHSNVGKLKTEVLKERILSINPSCNVIIINEKILSDNIELLFTNKPNYIIDACDTITTKINLIIKAKEYNIPIISVMGTGNKWNPNLIKITKLKNTSYDPLAKVMRRELKKRGFFDDVTVVASTEKINNKTGYTPGSNAIIPNIAGILAASYVINLIVKKY